MKNNILLILLLGFLLIVSTATSATDTNSQTNTSGSNTNITGGYTSTSTTTNNNDGQTNTTTNTTTNATTNNNAASDVPPPSANSPSYSSMSQDVCSMGISGSVSTGVFGLSGGKHITDLNCERIKLAKVLQDFGMKVASFAAMEAAGTPCPYSGLIGPQAAEMWKKYPELRPDYEQHLAKQEVVAKIDAEIAEKERIEAERIEAERIAAEEEAAKKEALRIEQELLSLKEKDEVNAIEPIIEPEPINVHGD